MENRRFGEIVREERVKRGWSQQRQASEALDQIAAGTPPRRP